MTFTNLTKVVFAKRLWGNFNDDVTYEQVIMLGRFRDKCALDIRCIVLAWCQNRLWKVQTVFIFLLKRRKILQNPAMSILPKTLHLLEKRKNLLRYEKAVAQICIHILGVAPIEQYTSFSSHTWQQKYETEVWPPRGGCRILRRPLLIIGPDSCFLLQT